mgnify:CR=1 FL=1
MALDVQGELNRLAGTTGLGEALAARTWAGVGCPEGYEVVGALNWKAYHVGADEHREKWLELQGVCNFLASTTGLGVAGALAAIP